MVKYIMDLLKKNNFTITFVESCTGGALAARFVEEIGASDYLNESYVTYANESKVNLIGVSKRTIDTYGVVSENVAYEMCVGAAKRANANICISTTGFAGPGENMGLICFGYYINGKTITKSCKLEAKDRKGVIIEAVIEAYNTLGRLLNMIK